MNETRKKRLLLLASRPDGNHKSWYSRYCQLEKEGLTGWTLGFAWLTPKGKDYLKDLLKISWELLEDRWEERAAILEYDAGYPRHEAENLAAQQMGYENKISFKRKIQKIKAFLP